MHYPAMAPGKLSLAHASLHDSVSPAIYEVNSNIFSMRLCVNCRTSADSISLGEIAGRMWGGFLEQQILNCYILPWGYVLIKENGAQRDSPEGNI
jgi:hypothetical protein